VADAMVAVNSAAKLILLFVLDSYADGFQNFGIGCCWFKVCSIALLTRISHLDKL